MAEKEAKKKEEGEERARVAKEKEAAFIAMVGEYVRSPWLEEELEVRCCAARLSKNMVVF